ncbi:thiol reductase thioredoxin [Paucibacter sp. KBW04]|uniref:thioredoxin family protein n=1 Tax=Paucibacter sp. KBW04 TaxID=2153361 RepID=UPI000F57C864|nr:thioredoxin family protein [Paucibacter sp. KBW04]RQO60533.1 thiol reductase thioredoxin [Paucibacter sp. KBW04]
MKPLANSPATASSGVPTDAHTRHAHTTLVACLCAAWCRTCDGYHETFAALRQQFPEFRFVWVDTEDDEELVGDLDVETFPTLLIGVGEELRFVGPVTPQLATAQRLLETATQASGQAAMVSASPAAQALLVRLQSSC